MYIFRYNKEICGYVVVGGGVENLMGNFDWKERKRWNRKKTKNLEEVTNSGRYNYSADRNCFAWFCTEGFYQTF